ALILLHRVSFRMNRRPSTATLCPYTTLFRSRARYLGRIRELLAHFAGSGEVSLEIGALRRAPAPVPSPAGATAAAIAQADDSFQDRKSTRLNSSHVKISYAVFCLKRKTHLLS